MPKHTQPNWSPLSVLLLLCVGVLLTACDDGASPRGSAVAAPTSVEAAWIGEGTFRAQHGTAEVKAQLEVLSDGSYRMLFLEPKMLMLGGAEKGTWQKTGNKLVLTPTEEKPTPPAEGEKPSVMDALRGGSPRELRVKELTVESDFSALSLSDGKMNIRFTPNAEATAKLKASGQL